MNTGRRIGLLLGVFVVLLSGLAFSGVRFADKPVTWMPVAFGICLLLLLIGFVWAYRPILLQIKSTLKRYTVQTTLTVLSVIVSGLLGYVLFVNIWLLLGGGL